MKHEKFDKDSVFQKVNNCPKSAPKAQEWDQGHSSKFLLPPLSTGIFTKS